jgi:predicted nucleotidyltransferase
MDEAIVRVLQTATPTAQELFERRRRQVNAVCRKNRLKGLIAFGSRVRDDRGPGSDLDLVTNFPAKTGLFDVMRITDELSQAFGCTVDLGSMPKPGSRLATIIQREGVELVGTAPKRSSL